MDWDGAAVVGLMVERRRVKRVVMMVRGSIFMNGWL